VPALEPEGAWIASITNAWLKGTAHTLELAGVVLSVRRALPRGGWARLWRTGAMPFSKSKGEMLVVIGARLSWANVQTFARLPAGWSILHQLCRLERSSLETLIGQGIVHPKLTLAEAKQLVTKRPGRAPALGNDVARRFQRLQQWVEQTHHTWLMDERNLAHRKLYEVLETIEHPRLKSASGPEASDTFEIRKITEPILTP
jgi:hypothetical protein